jgi:hypothetical protein
MLLKGKYRSLLNEIGDALHPAPNARDRWFLIVRYYVDVSGKQRDRVVAAGGYIASAEQWDAFEADWGNLLELAKAPGATTTPPFHATDFFGCYRHFKHFDKGSEEHRELGEAFAILAFVHPAVGYGYGIDQRAFEKEMARVYRKVKTPHGRMTPEMLVVSRVCNMAARGALRPLSGKTAIAFIEEGDGVGEVIEWLWHLKRTGEPWTAAFENFVPVPKSEMPVQAADLLAYETWWEIARVLKQPSRTWDDTRTIFKILAAGPAMIRPAPGGSKLQLEQSHGEHFRTMTPAMLDFLAQHPEYGWPRGHWRRQLRERLGRLWQDAGRFVRGKLRWFWYGVLKRPNPKKRGR